MSIYSTQYSSAPEDECLLCENGIRTKDFPEIIGRALERKYCSNLNNFFFSKIIDKILAKKRCRDYVEYVESTNFLEDEYFKRQYHRKEIPKKLKKLFPYYKHSSFRPNIFQRSVMRTHILFYYAQEQIKRGERVFDFSSTQNSSSTLTANQSLSNLQCLLKSINKYDPRYHFKTQSRISIQRLSAKSQISISQGRNRLSRINDSQNDDVKSKILMLGKSKMFQRKMINGKGKGSAKSGMGSYLLIQTLSEIKFGCSEIHPSRKLGASGLFEVNVSAIQRKSFLNGLGKLKSKVSQPRNSLKSKIKLESFEGAPSLASYSLLTTPNSKKDMLFRKDNLEKARLLDITEKKISSKKMVLKNQLNNQNCTKKLLNQSESQNAEKPPSPLIDRFKEQYYMNLSALKRRKGNETAGESSDKSLAAIINLLGEKFKDSRDARNLDKKERMKISTDDRDIDLGIDKRVIFSQNRRITDFQNLEIDLDRQSTGPECQFTYRKTEEAKTELSKFEDFSNLKTQKSQKNNTFKTQYSQKLKSQTREALTPKQLEQEVPKLEKIVEIREGTHSLKVSETENQIIRKSQTGKSTFKMEQPNLSDNRKKINQHEIKNSNIDVEDFKREHIPTPLDTDAENAEKDSFLAQFTDDFEKEEQTRKENHSKPDLLKVVTLSSKKVDFLKTLESRISILKNEEVLRPKLLGGISFAKILNFQKKGKKRQIVQKVYKTRMLSKISDNQNGLNLKEIQMKKGSKMQKLTGNPKNWDLGKLKIRKLNGKHVLELKNLNLENLEQNFLKHKKSKKESKNKPKKRERQVRVSQNIKMSLRTLRNKTERAEKIDNNQKRRSSRKSLKSRKKKKAVKSKSKSKSKSRVKPTKAELNLRRQTPNPDHNPKSQSRKKIRIISTQMDVGRKNGSKDTKAKRRRTLTIKTRGAEVPSVPTSVSPIHSISRAKSHRKKSKQKLTRKTSGKTRRTQLHKERSNKMFAGLVERQIRNLKKKSQSRKNEKHVKSVKTKFVKNRKQNENHPEIENEKFTRSKMLRQNLKKDIQKLNILSNRLSKMRSAEKSGLCGQLTFDIPLSQRNPKPVEAGKPASKLNLRNSLKIHQQLNIPLSKKIKSKPIWNHRIDIMRKELMSLSQENRHSVKTGANSSRHLLTFQNHKMELPNTKFDRTLEHPLDSKRGRLSRRQSRRHLRTTGVKLTNNKFMVDLKVLEENLKMREGGRVKDLRNAGAQSYKSSISNRFHEKTFNHKKETKIKIANYLKTERPAGREETSTPRMGRQHRSTKTIHLRNICLKKKSAGRKPKRQMLSAPRSKSKKKGAVARKKVQRKKTKPKNTSAKTSAIKTSRCNTKRHKRSKTENGNLQNQKKSVNSLNLSKRNKKMRKEETLLVLKSLESDRKAKRLLSEMDLFFLKDSKIKKRNRKKSSKRFSSKETGLQHRMENLRSHPSAQMNQFLNEDKWLRSKRRPRAHAKLNFTEAPDPFDSQTNQFNSIMNQKSNLINHFKMKFKTRPVNELLPVRDKSAGFCSDKKGY